MKTLILTFFVILFSSCTVDNADLGNSYYYLDSFEAIDVGYPGGAIVYKSTRKLCFDTTIITKEVVDAIHNDHYILAKQLANENKLDTSYYIIDKLSDKVYGPLDLNSFFIRKTHLSIKL